jgi:hypothetical protein
MKCTKAPGRREGPRGRRTAKRRLWWRTGSALSQRVPSSVLGQQTQELFEPLSSHDSHEMWSFNHEAHTQELQFRTRTIQSMQKHIFSKEILVCNPVFFLWMWFYSLMCYTHALLGGKVRAPQLAWILKCVCVCVLFRNRTHMGIEELQFRTRTIQSMQKHIYSKGNSGVSLDRPLFFSTIWRWSVLLQHRTQEKVVKVSHVCF